MEMLVSLVIPTLNAGQEIQPLLEVLLKQTHPADEIVVVDSSSDDDTVDLVQSFAERYPSVRASVINRCEFNHGGTRDQAVRELTTGDIVLFLTQDAVPTNEKYIENIIRPFSDARVGAVSGRQIPKADARRYEQLVRSFNYPAESFTRSKSDLSLYGIKTFFTSDVCSAYRRTAYLNCGGFCPTMMSEDMYIASKLIAANYIIAYASDATVYHSHNLKLSEQYKRNFATGYFLQEHEDILMGAKEISEGTRLVKYVSSNLLKEGRMGELISFGVDCVARLLGNRAGRAAARRVMKK